MKTKNFLERSYCESPARFAHEISYEFWQPAKHLLLLENYLLEMLNGENKRLIVSMPPRHGKSEFISKYFPAWYLGNNPDHRIILTSYESQFATQWGRQVQALMKEEFYKKIFPIELSKKRAASGDFIIENHKGGMYCCGTGGAVTGRGANLLIIDDPVKNDEEAHSTTYRDKVYDWFRSTAFTRLEPNGGVILLMTRWHHDDLAGRLIRDEPGKWTHLKLPAIAEENDPLGRNYGQALWEERFGLDALKEIRETAGEYWFSALYQQRPSISSGGIFKRQNFLFFDEEPQFYRTGEKLLPKTMLKKFATIDLATTTNESSDYTVCIIFGISPENDILILDVIREKIEGANHLSWIKQIFSQYQPLQIGIEAVQYQISLVQMAQNEGLPVKQLKADKDKLSRALPIAAKVEAGKVFFRRNAHWLGDFIAELIQFPNAKHDDQVDAFAYIEEFTMLSSSLLPFGKKIVRPVRG